MGSLAEKGHEGRSTMMRRVITKVRERRTRNLLREDKAKIRAVVLDAFKGREQELRSQIKKKM
jgi:hypothetical protein